MRVLLDERIEDDIRTIEHRIILTHVAPPAEQVTAALALAFSGDRLLLTDLVRRGLDLPGGHLEPDERPEEAMRREVYEETGAHLGAARLLAWERYRLLEERPPDYPYPYPDSYLVFYHAQVLTIDALAASEETRGAVLLTPEAARLTAWVRRNPGLYEAALAVTLTTLLREGAS